MRLTVLGKSPSWQDAGGACSGYLVDDGDTGMLLDCGNGVFSKLRLFRDYVDLDGVLISHLHADHFLDLIPYAYALTYAPRQQPVPVAGWPGTDHPARPELYAPPGAREVFRRVVGAWGPAELIEDAFELSEYDASKVVQVNSVSVRFHQVPHFMETFAMCIQSQDGSGRLVYGADCSPTDELTDFAQGCDLLIIEATLPRPERTGKRGHLTPREAGEHGRAAGAKKLLLTHISDELDDEWARREATEAFGGPVEVAREGAVYEV
jgi:ribonuclease BN (tRNA processing enzyme)